MARTDSASSSPSSPLPTISTVPSAPSTIGQNGKDGDFTTQAVGALTARPTNNIVNTKSFYDIVFLTGTSGAIKRIQVTFPVGTAVPTSSSFNEAEGIGKGTASTSGRTLTYTVTNAVIIPAGTKIRLEFSNINNPLSPSTNYRVTVTTRNALNGIIDGPTQSAAYPIKQIGANVIADNAITTPKIADNSITSTKPNEQFMKRVSLRDTPDGNALGWNPDGVTTQFTIIDTDVSGFHESFISVEVAIGNDINFFCAVVDQDPGQFQIKCSSPPGQGENLHYLLVNLPSHIIG